MSTEQSNLPKIIKPHWHLRDVVYKVMNGSEAESEAHKIYRSYPGHGNGRTPQTTDASEETVPGIQHPGSTGVIYCTDRAMANGFAYDAQGWSNLGQGAPEVGEIPGSVPKPTQIAVPHDSLEYAPTTGVKALRQAVADLYNHTYRQGMESQYTAENVCIVPGGRAGLSRVASTIGDVYCGYQVPEYTSYSSMLAAFRRLLPIPTALTADMQYKLDLEKTKRDIIEQGLQVIVASNPRNPTGQVVRGDELKQLVDLTRSHKVTVVLDEFYSWYIYPENESEYGDSVSSAAYVKDVNEDSVVIIDGLTKNWRLPGWRVCWVVGPKNMISALSQSGSFLDGGANHPLQLAAIPMLQPDVVKQDKLALQRHFKMKRDHVLARLEKMGLKVAVPPKATFYIWLDLSSLPGELNNGLTFFEELLKEKTIVVPGYFFDINPSNRRDLFASPCHHYVRISFGPPLDQLDLGLDAMERIISRAREGSIHVGGYAQWAGAVEGVAEHIEKHI